MKFIDEAEIRVASGHGGPGAVSFVREKYVPRGGPDGGDGGKGGDVIIRVNERLSSLLDFRYKKHFKAKNGQQGTGRQCSGQDGETATIEVPRGTLIKDAETGALLFELTEVGEEIVFLKGGRGGKGNTFFKTSVNQAPDHAQPGEPGEVRHIKMELKLLADAGIIGYPNAGKSTLISRISAARPKVADYPFTTLTPNLGVVRLGDGESIVVADIPGLIPGAHQGAGLGTKFLKHIERTKMFVHVIDVSGWSGRDPLQDFVDINKELALYDEAHPGHVLGLPLSQRKQVVVLNKVDAAPPELLEEAKRSLEDQGFKPIVISAVVGMGVDDLLNQLRREFSHERE